MKKLYGSARSLISILKSLHRESIITSIDVLIPDRCVNLPCSSSQNATPFAEVERGYGSWPNITQRTGDETISKHLNSCD